MTDHNATTNVVVIGGGYAGTTAANHLRMRTDVNITLVNPRPKFVERIRLHQHAAGDYATRPSTTARCSARAWNSWSTTPRVLTLQARRVELASGAARPT